MSEPFTLPHFERWASALVLDSGDRWVLDAYQSRWIADFLALPPGSVAWLVVPEGNGKTTLLAGLALYHIAHTTGGYVPVAASSREQAEWIYRQAEGFVFRSGLSAEFRCLEGYRRIRCDMMRSRIQVFAADDRSGDGIIPTLALLDELHRHRDLALYRTWMSKLGKRDAKLAVISTAGESGSEFEETRDALRQGAAVIERDGAFTRAAGDMFVLHDWSLEDDADPEDLEAVKRANPFGGVTVEALAQKRELPGMTQSHWLRFTCDRASRSVAAAITEQEWAEASTAEWIPEGEPVWAGLDVGWKRDTTALVPLWWRDAEFRLLGDPAILVPPRDQSSLNPHLVEDALLRLHRRNPIDTLVMDMSRAEQLAAWADEELGCTVVDRSQGNAAAAEDYELFMEGLRLGWLRHTGDPGLRQHVRNATARLLPLGDARFARPKEGRLAGQDQRVIDALVAAAMVHAVATRVLGAVEQQEESVPLMACV